ncbi:C40 family peptidase [Sulfurimonas sp. MAG313]|nr:NlpC/P60 family protein [Sulfurimonas sp. MAG313]MDF1880213.1 C40 family peptidase [Sulfurimonas sp. MAG313]
MKYIFYSLMILLVLSGCSRKPHTYNKPSTNHKKTTHTSTKRVSSPKKSSLLNRLYAQHRAWKGTPYRYGGLSKNGVDCSGFVYQTYKQLFKIKLPRSTKDQVRQGKRVYVSQLRAGDLVFFKTGRNVRHVGIYLEKGKFLHASSSKGVMISTLLTGYWKSKYWQSRRLF